MSFTQKSDIQPVLVAAAIDYDIVNGKRHGDLTRQVANREKSKRRVEAGLEQPKRSTLPFKPTPEMEAARELEGGSIIMGRHTFKEYMEGLRRGWTEPALLVDREEALSHELEKDGRFDEPDETPMSSDLEGEPLPTPSRIQKIAELSSPLKLPSYNPPVSAPATEVDAPVMPAPAIIPLQPPLLLVPFTNKIGFTQIPLMIYDFFNQRAKVREGAEAAYRLAMSHTRPISVPLSYDPSSSGSSADAPLDANGGDLDFDRKAEWYYKSSLRKFLSDIGKARDEYYKELTKRLETARALAYGTREPTKDERNHPPPTEVELRAERMKKELRWRGDEEGWEIVRTEKDVAWDERFRSALLVFDDPPEQSAVTGSAANQ